jgi:GNAT superfamily N-acetyltransferase
MLRWRGLFLFFLLTIREIFRPILYWYIFHIFARDLKKPLPEPFAKEKVDVTVYCGENNSEKARAEVLGMGDLPAAEIEKRLGRGDAVAIAYDESKAVGYMWLTFTSGMELAFDTRWMVRSDEGVKYDSFVPRKLRGRGIHSVVSTALDRYARERGLAMLFSSISVLNAQSMSLAKRLKVAKTMTVILVRVRGVKWTWRKATGAPLESRFSVGLVGHEAAASGGKGRAASVSGE